MSWIWRWRNRQVRLMVCVLRHRPELGEVGQVARVGVTEEWDATVGGHHKSEAADEQTLAL